MATKQATKEATKSATTDSMTDDEIVQKVVDGFNSSWNYNAGANHARWQDMDKLYNNERIYVGYEGISDTFVPMAFGAVEALVSATSGEKPVVEYFPTSPEQETNTKVLNGLFSFYWDLDNWTNKAVQSNRNYFKSGTTVNFFFWDIDHPVWQIIPLRDFFCDPSVTIFNYHQGAYIGHRFLASKSAMEKELIVNPDYNKSDKKSSELIPKYKNLDKLETSYETANQTDKQIKDTMMGSTLDKNAQSDQIEVMCYQTLDRMYYIGNRKQVIYDVKNPFLERQEFLEVQNPTGMFSYTVDACYSDESQLYGKSILEPIAKPQELLNDLTNQNVDAVSWALDPVMELDPIYSSYIDKIKNVTGAVYPFKPGSLQAVQKPIIPSNMFNERTNIKNEIREGTAVDEITKGINSQGQTTATEIKAQTLASGRRFELIVSQMEAGGYYRMAKLIYQMIQMYVTTPTMYRIVGKDGASWETFDPKMFKGNYEPRVKLKSTIEQEKNAKMRNLKEMYTALLGSPFVHQDELTRIIVSKAFDLDPEETQKLVKTQQDVAQEQAAQQPAPQGKPAKTAEEIALDGVAKAYGNPNTPGDIRAELEGLAGLQPSVTHATTMQTHLTQNVADQSQHMDTMLGGPPPDPGADPNAMPSGGAPPSAGPQAPPTAPPQAPPPQAPPNGGGL